MNKTYLAQFAPTIEQNRHIEIVLRDGRRFEFEGKYGRTEGSILPHPMDGSPQRAFSAASVLYMRVTENYIGCMGMGPHEMVKVTVEFVDGSTMDFDAETFPVTSSGYWVVRDVPNKAEYLIPIWSCVQVTERE